MHLTYAALHEVTLCTVVIVYTERAETAAVSCGTSPCQRCKYTIVVDVQKSAIKKRFTHVESHASAASLLESGEQRSIKAIKNKIIMTFAVGLA